MTTPHGTYQYSKMDHASLGEPSAYILCTTAGEVTPSFNAAYARLVSSTSMTECCLRSSLITISSIPILVSHGVRSIAGLQFICTSRATHFPGTCGMLSVHHWISVPQGSHHHTHTGLCGRDALAKAPHLSTDHVGAVATTGAGSWCSILLLFVAAPSAAGFPGAFILGCPVLLVLERLVTSCATVCRDGASPF